MNKIVIKRGIKFPEPRIGEFSRDTRGKKAIWPLADLKVGDGFEVPIEKANAVRVSIQHHQRFYEGVKFKTARDYNRNKLIIKRVS